VRGDYAANAGDGEPDMRQLFSWPLNFAGPADWDEAMQLTRTRSWPAPPADWTGISWLRTGVHLAAIRDGNSNKILFGEKYISVDAYRRPIVQTSPPPNPSVRAVNGYTIPLHQAQAGEFVFGGSMCPFPAIN
jgi:hypothetical protein